MVALVRKLIRNVCNLLCEATTDMHMHVAK